MVFVRTVEPFRDFVNTWPPSLPRASVTTRPNLISAILICIMFRTKIGKNINA